MTPKQMVNILDGQLTDCYAEIAEQQARIAELESALQGIFDNYKQLVDSGDVGNWSLEDTPEGKQAMLALEPKP
jgi:hypothetical protein